MGYHQSIFFGIGNNKLLWSLTVLRHPASSVRLSVNNFYKWLLLLNQWTDFEITSQECSLSGPLLKLIKEFYSKKNVGCCSIRKVENCQNFKNLLVQKYWLDLKIILHKYYLGHLLTRLFKFFRSVEKHGHQGVELVFLICAL